MLVQGNLRQTGRKKVKQDVYNVIVLFSHLVCFRLAKPFCNLERLWRTTEICFFVDSYNPAEIVRKRIERVDL